MSKVKIDKPVIVLVDVAENKPTNDKRALRVARRKNDIFRRKRSGEGINFFDLGQYNTGSKDDPEWNNLDFHTTRPITIDGGTGRPSGVGVVFGEEGWEDLKNKILETPLEEFSWRYRKLEYTEGELYYIDLYTGDPLNSETSWEVENTYSVGREATRRNIRAEPIDASNWTEDGLIVPSSENFRISSNILFAGVNTNKKITNLPTYESPEVPFTLEGKLDIFLVPQPCFIHGADGDPPFPSEYKGYVDMVFGLANRLLFLPHFVISNYLRSFYGYADISSPFFNPNYTVNVDTILSARNDVFAEARRIPEAKYFKHGTGYTTLSEFPTKQLFEWAYTTYEFANWPFNDPQLVSINEGALVAMIKRGNEWFYVWESVDNPVVKQFRVKGPAQVTTPTGPAPPPTVILNSFPRDTGLIATPGSGIDTWIYRRAWLNILGGYVSGPWIPFERQIQWSRFGINQYDQTRTFLFDGWGLGSYRSTWIWEVNRILRPEHERYGDDFRLYLSSSTQIFRVRDHYGNTADIAPAIWSDWATFNVVWPPDEVQDPIWAASAEEYRLDDS